MSSRPIRPRNRNCAALAGFLWVQGVLPGSARAEEVGTVRIGGSCVPPGTSMEATFRILQAELSPSRVEPLGSARAAQGPLDALVAIENCTEDPPGATVTVWMNGRFNERTVTLTDAGPDARDRTFALAIAEATRDVPAFTDAPPNRAAPLPAAPVSPVAPTPAPTQETTNPVARYPERDEAQGRRRGGDVASVRLRAAALVRFVASPATFLAGADVALAFRRWGVGVTGLGTERSVSLGKATLFALAAAPWVDLFAAGPASLRLGGELGLAAAGATPVRPATATPSNALHAALSLGIAATFSLATDFDVEAFLGGGYASSLTVQAGGREIAGLGGGFFTAAVGARFPSLE